MPVPAGIRLSPDQRAAVTFGDRPGRHVHIGGAMRSGKSMVATWGFLHWAGRNFTGHDFALAAKSLTQFQAITLRYMREFAHACGLALTRHDRCWRLESDDGGHNDFYPILYAGSASGGGAGGTGSVGGALPAARTEGTTLAGALIEEACECPEIMFDTLMDRTSVPGAKIIYSYYPQGAHHPLKTANVDKVRKGERTGELHHLKMEDNPANTAEYIAEQKAKWRPIPHEYKRRILGQWASATGIVYENFESRLIAGPDAHTLAGITRWTVAVDWAPESVSCALLIGYHPDHRIWYIYDEWHHDGHESGALPTGEKVDRMVAAMTNNGQREISEWVIDPSEDGVRVELKRLKAGRVIDAVADNDLGVKIGITYLDSGRVKISRVRCPYFLGELSKLSWDRRAALVGQTRVDKASAGGGHMTDCYRYWAHTHHDAATSRSGVLDRVAA